ncbi:MAG: flagellar basal body-associated FliL family protein [Rhizobiales bacterium]|nr:flagellar basal body-associated FliL family protein [Hyphomicrobiales bacterium]
MANEAVNSDDMMDDGDRRPSGKKKLILIGVAALLVLGGGGAGAYFYFQNAPQASADGNPQEAIAPVEPVVFFAMPEITVNLESVAGRQQYLKLRATLELRNNEEISAIQPFMPRVLDAFQVYLRELRTTDLEGSAGIFRLKEELQRRINVAVYPVQIRKVLFEEILIQ